ncbi:YggT family protein [Oceanispirochaeta sp.]|jgi:YggT family protein|uniref:YggT family protein n=1 Tax=Oceanispirochaeta sp. TaxID=2035350 RepID=UPI00262284D3|nr:YggT family protein [Oceanispirochaeta sp.]MDA3958832.1 YggT family protein [Oceanispirochaeta sp.]
MSPVQTVFQFLSALISVYMLLIIFRVFLTWFQGRLNGKGVEILIKVTDPYMNRFKGISWLRFGFLDFSPVVAIALLGLVSQIFNSLAISGTLTPMLIVVYILSSIWNFFLFFINFLIIMMVFRLITLLFFSTWNHQILFQIDTILYKVVARILGFFTTKTVKFSIALAVCAGILLGLRIAAGIGISFLLNYLAGL